MAAPASNELVNHLLRTACIGTISVDPDGAIGTSENVEAKYSFECVVFCCALPKLGKLAEKAKALLSRTRDRDAAVAAIRQAAAELSIGLTPHEIVVTRARAAVVKVEQTMADMQKSGALKAMNREFKAAREAGLASSYSAFIHAKKLALLEAMAAGRR